MVAFDFVKAPITKIVDAIIIESSKSGASDVHFDPRDDGMMVRRRIDGDLVDYTFIPKVYERNLTTRLKLMSGMNITESRLPQDGAIKGKFGDKDLDMRVSCLPTNEGEKIVIRILDYTRSLNGLGQLGFNEENFAKLKNMIDAPNGIILITGATGSGKSTTSYSILQALNKQETNIITVEDPIEMNIEGMNQVQVNAEIGLDFATVLRSILRQDPNVILIGEIRDSETAKIAVRASITGHLVISTIHTNNSLSTIERLLDMDVERYLLSTALTGIISQRLAKTVCPNCKITRDATPYEKKVFRLALNKDIDKIVDANHNGCSNCNKGYRGRVAVQEVLVIDDDIRSALNNPKVDKEDIKELVYGSGNVITLLQDGLRKILDGTTTFEEIYKIIEIDNDINDSCYHNDNEELTEKERIQLDQERSRELAELKRMEFASASKMSQGTTSIVKTQEDSVSNNNSATVPLMTSTTSPAVININDVNKNSSSSEAKIEPINTTTKEVKNSDEKNNEKAKIASGVQPVIIPNIDTNNKNNPTSVVTTSNPVSKDEKKDEKVQSTSQVKPISPVITINDKKDNKTTISPVVEAITTPTDKLEKKEKKDNKDKIIAEVQPITIPNIDTNNKNNPTSIVTTSNPVSKDEKKDEKVQSTSQVKLISPVVTINDKVDNKTVISPAVQPVINPIKKDEKAQITTQVKPISPVVTSDQKKDVKTTISPVVEAITIPTDKLEKKDNKDKIIAGVQPVTIPNIDTNNKNNPTSVVTTSNPVSKDEKKDEKVQSTSQVKPISPVVTINNKKDNKTVASPIVQPISKDEKKDSKPVISPVVKPDTAINPLNKDSKTIVDSKSKIDEKKISASVTPIGTNKVIDTLIPTIPNDIKFN